MNFIMEMRQLQGDLIAAFQYLGEVQTAGACSVRKRGNGLKMKENIYRLGVRKKFAT